MASKHNDILAIDAAAPNEVSELDLYQKREKIYTRKIQGTFQRLRLFTGWPLLLGYFCLPWLNLAERQSILFDLPTRKFHVLTLTFWPQDFIMLAFLLIIAAFALFTVTAFAGRVWCGYTCPQTVWTAIFMWIEQRFEGSRNQRIKLDKEPMSFTKFRKKFMKHTGWVVVAFWTGFTFVGYFTPIRALLSDFFSLQASGYAFIWIAIFTVATYLNAGYMREQVCIYMCPYARFQSAMFDRDTLIVS
jgi:cytochrome c oxidase accessory protein FixG